MPSSYNVNFGLSKSKTNRTSQYYV
jgi:hypothetical protein